MKVLGIGGGGREAAMALAIVSSSNCGELYWAPGNPGIARNAVLYPVEASDVVGLIALAASLGPDLVVVGPEKPLADGLANRLVELRIPCAGPSRAAVGLVG
ncbi:hypothetical protein A3H10_03330 [Candidatus Uhrbacteria bacterium RIFCSPLOWO2_12_FULL_46_10]|uniref:Phosphoribosylglycinamide synthetase N-terminal domain-containing protein n=1 Tax=Candidatus Uhrbacteria bacterium RIFCSPLOWO2_01_FULL_47_25 TaxID=1802402 RepID=A0A1F7UPS8_9BACT|nr:MAG: hypothetical protein A2752_00630 [Candidatus Uhrbacteria bacterium RIFCSPHIGHO2_01_FULL_46_23]OGL69196.1 MAG: hypothetical protein A3D60_04835 [Candidatus Uhrbacteria bacterium RIFCSPHIGHO2_02_FULL_47_29]OGL75303.1 MAG: hypothetical protein A3E96_01375 [Candidatus Uhrbacteria bacterium RIFCSPHIGHO2_12_FULL_46_13]OGL80259.1 MAG: hypothetical protein A2936_02740 [Candidatus Uhrbacteria bacterium RIFCSPLOWO2_01_FULL_47_25]OGL85334.1 MAG: hypothetical protein A3I37_00645 [Candidatus Uhrbact